MARRRFRYDPVTKEMVEISAHDRLDEMHFVRGDIAEFKSPIDGTVISSRAQYEDHCSRHSVVPYEPGIATREIDRYKDSRETRQRREMMWEMLDRAMRTGRALS